MFKNITVQELKNVDMLTLIDIRSAQKYNDKHIMNAVNIPSDRLLINYKNILDKNKIYYIYCQKGIQSRNICQILANNGYKVVNVLGGYEAWILNE